MLENVLEYTRVCVGELALLQCAVVVAGTSATSMLEYVLEYTSVCW